LRTVSEDQRERHDDEDFANDAAGWFGRNLDDAWVMVSPGIYRLREDMPRRGPGPPGDPLRRELPTGAPVERDLSE
jgi:hypothetical protein